MKGSIARVGGFSKANANAKKTGVGVHYGGFSEVLSKTDTL